VQGLFIFVAQDMDFILFITIEAFLVESMSSVDNKYF
jgi:hypothetical protein